MRKLIIVAAAVLLMVLAMAADSTPAGTGAGIAVDPASGTVSFGGILQEPAMTSSPSPSAEACTHHHRRPRQLDQGGYRTRLPNQIAGEVGLV